MVGNSNTPFGPKPILTPCSTFWFQYNIEKRVGTDDEESDDEDMPGGAKKPEDDDPAARMLLS